MVMFVLRKIFIGIPIRVNYFLFKNVAENRKYDPIRPNEAFSSLIVTTAILALACIATLILLFSGNFSLVNTVKVLVGTAVGLFAEKFLLTMLFNHFLTRVV